MSQIFTDIETVRKYNLLSEAPEILRELFINKFASEIEAKNGDQEAVWRMKAAFFAEFNKVVCIILAFIDPSGSLKMRSLASDNEKELIEQFADIAEKATSMVAHNGMDFDFAILERKCIIYGIPIPKVIRTFGKKPWDLALFDTMKMWSGSAFNYRASLALVAEALGIPSPKQNMDGSMVGDIYWRAKTSDGMEPDADLAQKEMEDMLKRALDKIRLYSQGDVITLVNIFQKMTGQKLLFMDGAQIIFL